MAGPRRLRGRGPGRAGTGTRGGHIARGEKEGRRGETCSKRQGGRGWGKALRASPTTPRRGKPTSGAAWHPSPCRRDTCQNEAMEPPKPQATYVECSLCAACVSPRASAEDTPKGCVQCVTSMSRRLWARRQEGPWVPRTQGPKGVVSSQRRAVEEPAEISRPCASLSPRGCGLLRLTFAGTAPPAVSHDCFRMPSLPLQPFSSALGLGSRLYLPCLSSLRALQAPLVLVHHAFVPFPVSLPLRLIIPIPSFHPNLFSRRTPPVPTAGRLPEAPARPLPSETVEAEVPNWLSSRACSAGSAVVT